MKKINFKDKHLRLGGYSALVTAVLVAVLLVVNVLFSSLNIKIDLTEENFFSLSEKTSSIINNIKDPVTIYVLEETGLENKDFEEILRKYEKGSSTVSVVYKDPVLYPSFAQKYMDAADSQNQNAIPKGSIIVENNTTGKYKVISNYELYNVSYTQSGSAQVKSVAIEERVTSAIDYVTSEIERKIYVTSGHGEYPVPMNLVSKLETENFLIENINLLTSELEVSPYNTLLMYSPHLDFAESEKEKIITFLEAGGKAMIFTDANTPELPNFNEILALYGVETEPGIVVEGSQDHMLSPYPTFILPNIADHEMTEAIKANKLPIVTPIASGLKVTDNKRSSVTITPLLTSSDNSWIKKNLDANTVEKESGDIDGPADIAYAIEDLNYLDDKNPISTKLFVMSNTVFLDNRQLNISATGNEDLIMNGFMWLQGKQDSLYIGPKAFTSYMLPAVSASTLLIFAGVAVVVLPLAAAIAGLVMWLRRRNL